MKYTPELIESNGLFFSIPIYQRLFEWNKDNIQTLLHDLRRTYDNSDKEEYYIGMLTTTTSHELVDGQQRFTVLMLLGCVLQKYDKRWENFIYSNENPRLSFRARPKDDKYLQTLINISTVDDYQYVNTKMKKGIDTISRYFIDIKDEEIQQQFAGYIYEHLSFFISDLPEKYGAKDLNKYFERMNCSGKNLEQHEILKVKLLSNLPGNISKYMNLWNVLADVDTPLIRKRNNENSTKERKERAFSVHLDDILKENIINGLEGDEDDSCQTILSIKPDKTIPKSIKVKDTESKCALRFPYILLHCLYWKYKNIITESKEDFFNPSNLLETFNKYLPYKGDLVDPEKILCFINLLLRSRLALDICFIRLTDYGYDLDFNASDDNEDIKKLLMLESMLYVSSSNYTNYKWFGWLMDYIESCHSFPDARKLYDIFKNKNDEKNNKVPDYKSLSYGEINRYWFWRLDMYIWLNRADIFKSNPRALAVAEKYVFIRNRSIEHIAPQSPKKDSAMIWQGTEYDNYLKNSFGNIVMISSGLNSSLNNESYEIKKAHVEAYCNGSKSGSIESLKLLVAYQNPKEIWDRDTIEKHGRDMYELLKKEL